jgi:hypothetical protein
MQHALQHCDRQAVIRHRHGFNLGFRQAREHFLPRHHAAAAMNDQATILQIRGEIVTGASRDIQLAAGELPQPTRNLHPPDIVFQRMVRTTFGNQDSVTRLETVERNRPQEVRRALAINLALARKRPPKILSKL